MPGPLEFLEDWLRGLTKGSAPIILMPHAAVHEGDAYSIGGLSTGIATTAQINFAFWNPSGSIGKEAHTAIQMSAGGQAYGFLYEGGSLSASGTFAIPEPLNRVVNEAQPPQWRTGFNVAVNTLGTLIGSRFLGGGTGTNPSAARNSGREESGMEWILSPEHVYILVLHNTSGATIPAHIILEYYEKD